VLHESQGLRIREKGLNEVLKDYAGTFVAGKALFLMGNPTSNRGCMTKRSATSRGYCNVPEPELRNSAVYRLGWIQCSREMARASETFKAVGAGSPLFPSAQDLSAKSLGGELLPFKDPTTAGALSLCPDLGTPTLNGTKTVLWPFSSTAFHLGHDRGFPRRPEVLGAVLGVVGLGFYTGTIYSAVNSAHKYNRKLKDDFLQGLPDAVDLSVFATKEATSALP